MSTGTPHTGVKKLSEWVSQIPRKCWIERDSFMMLTSVFLHPYFIDTLWEKTNHTSKPASIYLGDKKSPVAHLRPSRNSLCAQENTFFSPPVTNYYKIQQVSDIHLKTSTWESRVKLPEHQTASHRGLMFPIFVQRGEMSQAHLTLVCL